MTDHELLTQLLALLRQEQRYGDQVKAAALREAIRRLGLEGGRLE